jgi:hypothetical protein
MTEHSGQPWQGAFLPYSVGDPGRAPGQVVPLPDFAHPQRPDIVVDGFSVVDDNQTEVMRVRAAGLRGLAHRYYGRVR